MRCGARLRRERFAPVLNCGAQGVDLFFILSGFVLTWNYLDTHGPSPGRCARPLHFLWLRLARVWPVYLVTLHLAALWIIFTLNVGHVPSPDSAAHRDQLRPPAAAGAAVVPAVLRRVQLGRPGLVDQRGMAGLPAVRPAGAGDFPDGTGDPGARPDAAGLRGVAAARCCCCWSGGSSTRRGVGCRESCMQFTAGALACAAVRRLRPSDRAAASPGTCRCSWSSRIVGTLYLLERIRCRRSTTARGRRRAVRAAGDHAGDRRRARLPRCCRRGCWCYGGQISFCLYMVHELVHTVLDLGGATVRAAAMADGQPVGRLDIFGLLAIAVCSSILLYHVVEEPARRWMRRMVDATGDARGSQPRRAVASSSPNRPESCRAGSARRMRLTSALEPFRRARCDGWLVVRVMSVSRLAAFVIGAAGAGRRGSRVHGTPVRPFRR